MNLSEFQKLPLNRFILKNTFSEVIPKVGEEVTISTIAPTLFTILRHYAKGVVLSMQKLENFTDGENTFLMCIDIKEKHYLPEL